MEFDLVNSRVIKEVYSTPCISFHKLSEKQQAESQLCSLCHFSKPMIRLQFACPVSKQSCYWLRCWGQGQITPSEGSQLNTLPFVSTLVIHTSNVMKIDFSAIKPFKEVFQMRVSERRQFSFFFW